MNARFPAQPRPAQPASPMDSPFSVAELKVLWERFEGSPFAFWDRIYSKSKGAATVSQVLDPLLGEGSDESFVQRILTAARGHPAQS
ncbi:MAG: hypothetical protein OXF67_00260 [Cyanobacteria bacterium MAG CAR4_bin_6]|nr:hypothetical protein [Cyanobacteria bacterium MAG CAR4_bin_6]